MNKVTRKELASVIGKKTFGIKDQKKLVEAIASYIVTENQSIDLDLLTRDIMQYRLEQGYVEAVAVSAHELDEVVLKDITNLLKEHFPDSKSIVVSQRQDESLVGGVRIDLPMESLDLSVRSKLNMFKRLVAEERT